MTDSQCRPRKTKQTCFKSNGNLHQTPIIEYKLGRGHYQTRIIHKYNILINIFLVLLHDS